MIAPEFHRPYRLDRIGAGEVTVEVEADAAECAALARRFGLVSLDLLTARFSLRQEAAGVRARGDVRGRVTQACVATGEPVVSTIDEAVDLLFLPEGTAGGEEIELSADEVDTMFFAGGAIDLGEAAAETLALALDPFPRSPDADAALRDAGVLREEEAGPFAALKSLGDRLRGE